MSVEVGWLCVGGIEIIHDARVLSYLHRGLAGAAIATSVGVAATGSVSGIVEAPYSDTYCLTPDHRLLTADLRWVPCGDVVDGDQLLAAESAAQPGNRNRRWEIATVTRSERRVAECVRVHLANGDIITCTIDHPWLARAASANARHWVRADELIGQRGAPRHVARLFDPWDEDRSYEAGWLSGMFDGEGCVQMNRSAVRLALAQVPGPVLDRVVDYLERMKFEVTVSTPRIGSAATVSIRGGFGEIARALGTLRPLRLLNNYAVGHVAGRTIKPHWSKDVEVIAVEHIGLHEVQSIATSTGTYIGEGYAMHNSDDYGIPLTIDCGEGFAPVCLECACPTLTLDETFTDPATDDAPWYQAADPRSAEFLGAIAVTMDLPPATERTQAPRTRFGGTPSPQRLLPRIMQVTAQLFAATPGGLEWGKRWLYDVLAGACDGGADATFLPYCPADDQDPDTVYRVLADTVLVDGPTFAGVGSFSGFRVVEARFQLSSVAPWLLGLPAVCSSGSIPTGGSESCLIETDDWGGGQAVRVELGGDMAYVTVRAVPLAADQDCPVDGVGMACSEFTVGGGTQVGDVIVVDASRRSALLTDISSKNDVSAVPYLDFVGPFPWIEAPPCTRLCVTVINNGPGTVTYTVDTVRREL